MRSEKLYKVCVSKLLLQNKKSMKYFRFTGSSCHQHTGRRRLNHPAEYQLMDLVENRSILTISKEKIGKFYVQLLLYHSEFYLNSQE